MARLKKRPKRPTGYELYCRLRAAFEAEIKASEIGCRGADHALRQADGEVECWNAERDLAAANAWRRTWKKAAIILDRVYKEWADDDLRALRAGLPLKDRDDETPKE